MPNPHRYFVWDYARDVVREVYAFIATLPPSEEFNLVSQMRRSATSIRNNIREGAARQNDRAMLPFLYYARSSASELYDQFWQCRELTLGDQKSAKATCRKAGRLDVMLHRLIKQKESRLDSPPRRRPRRTQ